MAVENSKVGPIEEMAQSWQDEIEGRVKGLQTGSYARILKMARSLLNKSSGKLLSFVELACLCWGQ